MTHKKVLSVILTLLMLFGVITPTVLCVGAATRETVTAGDKVVVTGSSGYQFYYTADGGNGYYYGSYMDVVLSEHDGVDIDWASGAGKAYKAWCATYGAPVPSQNQEYLLTTGELRNGEYYYYDDGLKEYIPFDWALSVIKATEALAKKNGHLTGDLPAAYRMATEIAIRCITDTVEAEKLNVTSGYCSAAAQSFLDMVDWSVADFYGAVKTIYNNAKANLYEYAPPVTQVVATSVVATPYYSGDFLILGGFTLNVKVADVNPVLSSDTYNGVELAYSDTGKNLTIRIHKSFIKVNETIAWSFTLGGYTNGETYTMLCCVPIDENGNEISTDTVQKMMVYDSEPYVTAPVTKSGRYNTPEEKATVTVEKTDTDGNKLSGISFDLYSVGTNNALMFFDDAYTNSSGEASWTDLDLGYYFLTEGDNSGWEPHNQSSWTVQGATSAEYTTIGGKTGWKLYLGAGTTNVKVSAVNKRLLGSLKIVKTSEDGVVSGLKFKITGNGVDKTVTTGSDGTITVTDLLPGTYTVTETNVPTQYVAPASKTVTVQYNKTATVSFDNVLKRGSLKIVKTSEDGVVSGLKFKITGNGVDKTVTTGSDGTISVSDLLPGTYTVTETNVPTQYVTPASKTVTVQYNKTATVSFDNVLKRGSLKIVKTSEDGVVSGLSFKITGNGVDKTVTTGSDGTITVTDLLPGTYTVTETNVPSQYVAPSSKTVTVQYNKTATVSFDNVLKRGSLKIVKTSEDGVVSGLKFKITGNGVDKTVTTGSDGTITVTDLLPGTYTVTETNVPTQYVAPSSKTVTVQYNKTATVSFDNVLKKAQVIVFKTSYNNVVDGIEFTLSGNGYVSTGVTEAGGLLVFTDVPIYNSNGEKIKYTLTENIGSGGFSSYPVFSSEDVTLLSILNYTTFEIGEGDNVVNVYNPERTGEIMVMKNSDLGKKNGFTFVLEGVVDGKTVFSTEGVTNHNGELVFSTVPVYDRNGNTIIYTLSEKPTALYQTMTPVEVDLTAEGAFYYEHSYTNILKPGELQIVKTADDGLVAGVKFVVTSSLGKTWTVYTDADGKATLSDLDVYQNGRYVTYTVTEADVPLRYEDPGETRTFTFENAMDEATEETVYFLQTEAFHNSLKTGSVVITKTAEDGAVDGFKFMISSDNGYSETITLIPDDGFAYGEVVGLPVFNADNQYIKYTVTEVETPERYIAPKPQTFTFKDVSDGGRVVAIEAHNALRKGQIELIKTSEDGCLTGFKFRITSSAGYDKTITLEALEDDGFAYGTVSGLPIFDADGEYVVYTVTEVETPERYLALPSVSFTFADKLASMPEKAVYTYSVEVHNVLKRMDLTVVKTNIDNVPLSGALFALECSADGGETWLPVTEEIINFSSSQHVTENLFLSDENGEIDVSGLIACYRYRLIETEAPEGYMLLASPVVVDSADLTQTEICVEVTVVNHAQLLLPTTGESGFKLIPISALFLCLAIWLGIGKRKKTIN